MSVDPTSNAPCLLALDTATNHAAVALVAGARGHFVASPDPLSRHGRRLLPTVLELLERAGLKAADIEGVVVGTGPGSYTGLRVGVTAAKTLAYALNRPLASFDSLALIARNAPAEALRVDVIADAQRGDVYLATFAREGPGAALVAAGPAALRSFGGWADALEPGTLVLGPAAAAKGATGLPGAALRPATEAWDWPDSEALAGLAAEVWGSGVRADLWALEPNYLRRSAAEDQWERLGKPS